VSKALIITEKPSVARDIAAALGGFREEDGYLESEDYVLTWAVGHLFELQEPEEIDEAYKRWTLDTLPILPAEFKLKPKSGQAERIRTLRKLLKRKDISELINACDAGREGELIFREIVKHFGTDLPIRRLWLQSMTPEAIREGFAHLRDGRELEGLASAAECRAFSDWIIGMNATRALTKRLKSRKEKTAWSAGRVQTPTLALLVDRELEILAHQPRPFWRVEGTFAHPSHQYAGTWFDPAFRAGAEDERDDRIFDEARARAIVEAVAGHEGVARETRKPARESAPPLFDLTSLQREANRRFGWSARRTLGAAQRCYEAHKLLTYPRTDSRCLPSDYRETVGKVIRALAGDTPYRDPATRLLERGLENEARVFDDSGVSDHFAIIPTGVLPDPKLSGDDRRLYDLVVRRFLGAFYPPAVWERVERITEVAGEHFRTRARSLVEPGWRFVLGEEESSEALPRLDPARTDADGVPVRTVDVEAVADETRPPPRITEARLLTLMENAGQQVDDESFARALHEKGIGTPATRAEIIENLIRKGYVVRVGKALRPTVKGIRLVDTLRRIRVDRLASAELTGELEHHLLEVERGERSPEAFMAEIEDYATSVVDRAKSFEYDEVYADEPPVGRCPYSGRPVVEQAWFYTCQRDPGAPAEGRADPTCPFENCPLLIWKDTSGRYIDRQAVATLLEKGETGVLDGFTARNGRIYKGILYLDREEGKVKVRSAGSSDDETVSAEPEYDVNPEPLGRCPFDEDCQVIETPTQFICARKQKEMELGRGAEVPKSCGFVLPRTVCKREITREEAQVYLARGRTDLLEDFTSRFGRPFSATLVLKENGRHGFEFPPRKKKTASRKATTRKASARKVAAKTAAEKTAKKAGRRTAKQAGTKKAAAARSPSAASASGGRAARKSRSEGAGATAEPTARPTTRRKAGGKDATAADTRKASRRPKAAPSE